MVFVAQSLASGTVEEMRETDIKLSYFYCTFERGVGGRGIYSGKTLGLKLTVKQTT